ncbi:19084_t:CDS:10 [Rhizophagus irregularis]|nr:19084_t:CDS:10 [Rhizophagus irregularis]
MYRGWPFTGWGLVNIPSTIQKRLLKFLLKRALGQFLAEDIDLDLDVQLSQGLLRLKELKLNVEVLNDLVVDLPVVITDGKIGAIVANIPWKNIWNCDCVLEICNLQITVVPEHAKPRNAKSTPEDSHILSSSFHFAGDFLRHERLPPEEDEELRNSIYHSFHSNNSNAFPSESQELGGSGLEQSETLPQQSSIPSDNGIEGVQILARLIDKLMSNVKIILKDTCIRLSHQSTISLNGDYNSNKNDQLKEYCFELKIPEISFKDETPGLDDEPTPPNVSGSASVTLPPEQAETIKSFTITGLNIWLKEVTNQWIHQQSSQRPQQLNVPKTFSYGGEDSGDEFFDSHSNGYGSDIGSENEEQKQTIPYEAMIFSCSEHENIIRVTLSQNSIPTIQFDAQNAATSYYLTQEAMQQAKSTQSWNIEGLIQSLTAVLTPSQVSLIADLADALSRSKSSSSTRPPSSTESDDLNQFEDANYRPISSPIQNDDFDDLLYQHEPNKINSTSIRNKGDLRNHQKESSISSQGHFKPYYIDSSKNNFYNLELDREYATSSSENFSFVKSNNSPPNHYKSSLSHPPNIASSASNIISSGSNASSMKIDFKISSVELFILYLDPSPNFIPEKKFFDTRLPENLNLNHIKISIDGFSCLLQRWDPENLIDNGKRRGSVSNINYPPNYQKNLDNEEYSRILMEIAFSDISILEWLEDPLRNKSEFEDLKSEVTLPNFNTYNPLLFFDPELLNFYDPEESDFPTFPDVIKIKVEITNLSNEDTLSSTLTPSNVLNYDIAVDLQPVQLHFDLRIIDRLENYILALSKYANSASPEETSTKHIFNEKNIIDDLDTQRMNEKKSEKFHLRINCDLIRMMLHCPDLGASNTHEIVEDYCIHSNLMIFDIINIHVATGVTKSPGIENYGIQQHSEPEGRSGDLQQNRIKIECGGVNIFLKESNDSDAKCFLAMKPLTPSTHHRSMAHISPMFPNVEITYRPTSAVKSKLPFIGGNVRSSPFSQTFSSFEGEDRSSWPVENEEEEILIVDANDFDSNEQDSHFNMAGNYQSDSIYGMNSYNSESSEMRMRFEGGSFMGSQSMPLRPSLASVVVFIAKVEVVILYDPENPEKKASEKSKSTRIYQLNMLDFRFFSVIKHEGKTKNTRPMISIIMLISLDVVANMKETNLTLSINGVTLRHSQDTRWIDDLLEFIQEPEMAIDFNPNNIPGRVIVVLDSLKASSNIISGSPMFAAKLIVQNLDLMLVGDDQTIQERAINKSGSSTISVKKYWKLELTNEHLTIETCADTFQTLLNLINHLTPKEEISEKGRKVHITTAANRGDDSDEPVYKNMLESLDMDAFKHPLPKKKPSKSPASNLEFVEEYYTIEENESDEQDTHLFDNAVIFDNTEDVIVRSSKASESRDDMIKSLDSEPLNFSENHFAVPSASELDDSSIQEIPNSLTRIKLRDFNLVWKLYDGYDWEQSKNEVMNAYARAKAHGNVGGSGSLIGETSSNSLETDSNSLLERFLGSSPFNKNSDFDVTSQTGSEVDYIDDHSDTASQVSSRLGSENTNIREGKRPEHSSRRLNRSKSSKLDIKLEKVNLDIDIFPNDNILAFRLLLLIRDVEILDNIKTSAWHKFLSHMRPDNDTSPRESKSNMVRIELNSVRPTPTDSLEELRLKARFLPLRFYIDQDALQFIIQFFSFQDSTIEKPPKADDNTYFQSIEIHPIKMKIDYKPKHIDYANLKEGNLVELMNFFHFEAAEMTLNNVKLTGVKGWQRLAEELGAAWLPHIKSTQVPNVVSGVAPIRSLVNLGSGVADLILLPIEQYKKDGRVIRGLQKGTQSFARATTMEAIKFGTKLAVGTQILLEHADEILSFESQTSTENRNNSSNTTIGTVEEEFDSDDENTKELISKYANQPADLNEGIEKAYKSLRTNIGTAAHTIFAVPMEVYEKTGTQGTVRAVIRAVPVAVLKPMIGATEAVSQTLLGLRNSIDPNKKLQTEDKYKKR